MDIVPKQIVGSLSWASSSRDDCAIIFVEEKKENYTNYFFFNFDGNGFSGLAWKNSSRF